MTFNNTVVLTSQRRESSFFVTLFVMLERSEVSNKGRFFVPQDDNW